MRARPAEALLPLILVTLAARTGRLDAQFLEVRWEIERLLVEESPAG